jgi:hypothetical protein
MAFTFSPLFDGGNYNAVYNSCINVSIYIETDQVGGEDITNLSWFGGDFTVSGAYYLDGSVATFPYTVAYGTPALLQFDLCSGPLGASSNMFLDVSDGLYSLSIYGTAKAAITNYVDIDSIDFGTVAVGVTVSQEIIVYMSPDGYLADVSYVVPSLSAPYSMDPAYPSTFTLSQDPNISQIIQVNFTPTAAGTFSRTLNIAVSTAKGPGSSWTNPVFTIPITITGEGNVPAPATYKSSRLSIMNGISM